MVTIDWDLERLHDRYVAGAIDIEEFETAIERVLKYPDGPPPAPRPTPTFPHLVCGICGTIRPLDMAKSLPTHCRTCQTAYDGKPVIP